MRRREFITLVGGVGAAWPLAARAQQERMRRIGVIMGFGEDDKVWQVYLATFKRRLQDFGWSEGRNIRYDYHFTGDSTERMRGAAAEVVGTAPDVIFVSTNPVVSAVQQLTRSSLHFRSRRRSTEMRHTFSIVCIGLIIWLANDKIAATYQRENWVAVLKNPTKCNTREEMDKVVALMMQRENGTASSFWSSCQELQSGTEVFVELVPYFNLCIRTSDEVSCMWSDEGWKMRIVK